MMHDTIFLSSQATEGIGLALEQDFCRYETPDRMAWIVLLLKITEDRDEFFPNGKWATIQSIESQLAKAAQLDHAERALAPPEKPARAQKEEGDE